jgi:hypothetical protein
MEEKIYIKGQSEKTGQDFWDGQQREDKRSRTAMKGQLGQDRDSWDRAINTGQMRQDNFNGTAKTGHLEQDSHTGQSGEVDLTDKTTGTGSS